MLEKCMYIRRCCRDSGIINVREVYVYTSLL